jgi:hypothetical protein
MDNLKLIGKTEEALQKQIQTVRTIIDDIYMKYGLDNCSQIVLKKGILVHSQNLILDINREIQEPGQRETCKYLGIEESEGM